MDLCREEFSVHFQPEPDGSWIGLTESGRYTIDKLRLNRKHLVELRRLLRQRGFDAHKKGMVEDELLRLLRN